ncbi:MAG: TlpA family protein disulfide reductase [Acidobacteriia bacterium]|nr:TlpA family protein disulfide reductase [Terriglobia bacterium]
MRTLASLALVAALTVPAVFAENAPKKAPDFTFTDMSGKQVQLSTAAKGKVCVLTFILTTCPHCQRESQMLTKMYKEMAPRGLSVYAVAVNDNAAVLIPGFAQQFEVGFPVGFSSPDAMMSFMGFSPMERWVVPQVTVIDRKGMIRAQSPYSGDPNLQSETYMHSLLDGLLKEGAATTKTGAKATKTTASTHHQ